MYKITNIMKHKSPTGEDVQTFEAHYRGRGGEWIKCAGNFTAPAHVPYKKLWTYVGEPQDEQYEENQELWESGAFFY